MKCRSLQFGLSVVLLALLGSAVSAQSPPGPIGPSVTGANQPTSEQSAQIKQYATHWTGILKNPSSKPEEIEDARARLLAPLNNVGVSPRFRLDYAEAALPDLEQAIARGSLHAGVNAMLVAASIGGDKPATLLVNQAYRDSQPKWQLRLQAAFGAATLFRGKTLDSRKLIQSVTRLRDAVRTEEHPLVLRHILMAMEAADQNELPPADRQICRQLLTEALVAATDAVSKNHRANAEPFLLAINEPLQRLRDKLVLDVTELKTAGLTLGPMLGKMAQLANANWDVGQADARMKRSYSAMIASWEGFFARIDATVRGGAPGQLGLRAAWDSGDKARYEAELAKWAAALKLPPYPQQ